VQIHQVITGAEGTAENRAVDMDAASALGSGGWARSNLDGLQVPPNLVNNRCSTS
jgi:hypothetical protein